MIQHHAWWCKSDASNRLCEQPHICPRSHLRHRPPQSQYDTTRRRQGWITLFMPISLSPNIQLKCLSLNIATISKCKLIEFAKINPRKAYFQTCQTVPSASKSARPTSATARFQLSMDLSRNTLTTHALKIACVVLCASNSSTSLSQLSPRNFPKLTDSSTGRPATTIDALHATTSSVSAALYVNPWPTAV